MAVGIDRSTSIHAFNLYTQGYTGWPVKCREKGKLIIRVKPSRRMLNWSLVFIRDERGSQERDPKGMLLRAPDLLDCLASVLLSFPRLNQI